MKQQFAVQYDTIVFLCIFHILTAVGLYYFSPGYLILALCIWPLSHGIGLAVGYHRLLTHQSFECPKIIEYIITIFGLLTLQGGHIKWVAIHRAHHQYTDEPEDPHTPRQGFWHSHIGWMLYGNTEYTSQAFIQKYGGTLNKDKFHRFFQKLWWLPTVILAVILFAFGGVLAVIWGIIIPVTIGLHFTWLVNSACHLWGSQRFKTNDDSTNNWWVSLLTWGEGWHNNHHESPRRACYGLEWYQFDPSWWFICVLRWFGLAKKVVQ